MADNPYAVFAAAPQGDDNPYAAFANAPEALTPEEIRKRAQAATLADMSGGEQALAAAGGGFARAVKLALKPGAGILDLFRSNPMLAMSALGNPVMMMAALQHAPTGALGQQVDASLAAQDQQDASLKAAAPVSYGVGASAPLLAVPELAPMRALGLTGRMAGIFDMAANSAAQGAGTAAASGDDAATGAAFGALGGPVAAGVGNLAAKGVNAFRGAIDPAVSKLMEQAKAAGIPLTIGDLGSNAWSQVEAFLKHTPLSGMRGLREQQAKGVIGATQDLGQDLMAGAPAQDLEQSVAESARREYARRSAEQDRLYGEVPKDTIVTTHETTPALAQLVTQFDDVLSKSGASKDTKDIIAQLTKPAQPTDTDAAILKFYGDKAKDPNVLAQIEEANPGFGARISGKGEVEPQDLTVDQLHDLRKKLGNVQRSVKAQVNSGHADAEALSMINDVRDAIDNDFASAGTGDELAAATKFSREQIMPYRNNKILADLLDGEGQGVLGKVSQKGNKDTASLLMDAIDPQGQRALQAGLYDKLIGPGIGDHLAAGYSPSRLLNALRIGANPSENRAANQIFSPEQLAKIGDLRDLTSATRGAAGYATETAGGAKLLPYYLGKIGAATGLGAGGAFLGGIPGVIAPFVAARGLKGFTASPAMQKLWYAQGGRSQLVNNVGAQAGADLFDQLSQ